MRLEEDKDKLAARATAQQLTILSRLLGLKPWKVIPIRKMIKGGKVEYKFRLKWANSSKSKWFANHTPNTNIMPHAGQDLTAVEMDDNLKWMSETPIEARQPSNSLDQINQIAVKQIMPSVVDQSFTNSPVLAYLKKMTKREVGVEREVDNQPQMPILYKADTSSTEEEEK